MAETTSNNYHDPAPPDTTSFGTIGTEAVKAACKEKETLTTTTIVCGEENNCAEGPPLGVDDHTAKLPSLREATSCAVVTSKWIKFLELELSITEHLTSKTPFDVRKAPADEAVTNPILKEPEPSSHSLKLLEKTPMREASPKEARKHEPPGDSCMADMYAKWPCEKSPK